MSPPIGSHKGEGKRRCSQSVKVSTHRAILVKQGKASMWMPLYSIEEAGIKAGLKA